VISTLIYIPEQPWLGNIVAKKQKTTMVVVAMLASCARRLHFFDSSTDTNTPIIDKRRNTDPSLLSSSTSSITASITAEKDIVVMPTVDEQAAAINLTKLSKSKNSQSKHPPYKKLPSRSSMAKDKNRKPARKSVGDTLQEDHASQKAASNKRKKRLREEDDDDTSPLKSTNLFKKKRRKGISATTVTPRIRRTDASDQDLLAINDDDSPEMKQVKKLAQQKLANAQQLAAAQQLAKSAVQATDKHTRKYKRTCLKKLCPAAHAAITNVVAKLQGQGIWFLPQVSKNYHRFSMKKQTLCGLVISEIKKITHSKDPTLCESWEGYWETKLLDALVYAFGQRSNRKLQKMREKVTSRYTFVLCACV